MSRKISALHVHGDFAVRPGVVLAIFKDGSQLGLFDSFKPACGYSTYWLAIKTGPAGTWWHVDMRDIVPQHEAALYRPPGDPLDKVAFMRDLLVSEFDSAQALLDKAQPGALVVDKSNFRP